MRHWLGSGPDYSKQGEGDLGERIHAAFIEAFQKGDDRVVLIGTDVPRFTTDHLATAFDALEENDLVLGPTTDGGYWLIGLKRPVNLFQDVAWGSDRVFDQTTAQAKGKGLKSYFLEPVTDIDTVKDLKKWMPEYDISRPYVSVIIPVLNEGDRIEGTIQRVKDPDVEVIVVDGGSHDDTVSKARAAGARVESGHRGRARQQNRGAAIARGHVLQFLHADTRLPRDYVDHIFEALMDPGTVVGAFRFKTDLNSRMMKWIEYIVNLRSQYFKLPYGDQGLFIRKNVFESIGGFPDVPLAEDLFLVRRLSKRGRIRIAPAEAITSARRWQRVGLLRNSLLNIVVAMGCYLGIPPHVLLSLQRFQHRK
jgi:hypothetical protein